MDYEDLILEKQESEEDDCSSCTYNPKRTGKMCNCQCEEIVEIYNPYLPRTFGKIT